MTVKAPVLALVFVAACLSLAVGRAGAEQLLLNPGFEQGLAAWAWDRAQPEPVASPVHSGQAAIRLAGTAQYPHRVYQWLDVQPSLTYELAAWVWNNDPNVASLMLQITWFKPSGDLINSESSPVLTGLEAGYRQLATGARTAPPQAGLARVGVLVTAVADFQIYLDDFSFAPAAVQPSPAGTPSSSESPSPTPAPTPGAGQTSPSPSTTTAPAPATPAPATPPPEPVVFPSLVNGGFEELRADGTPYGWRKAGGQITANSQHRADGERALEMTSRTGSTKWAYQVVRVQAGSYYQAEAMAFLPAGTRAELFLRVSWYVTDDGSGPLLHSGDSTEVLRAGAGGFTALATSPVQAPSAARSAAIRLMVRPFSSDETTVYFDAVRFAATGPPAAPEASPIAASSQRQTQRRPGERTAAATGQGTAALNDISGADAAVAGATGIANVKPEKAPAPIPAEQRKNSMDWALIAALAVPLLAIAAGAGFEFVRRRSGPGAGDG